MSQAEALKEENDSLRWQLDAYRNEVELLKQEQGKAHREDDPNKEQQLQLLQQALQGMQQVWAVGFPAPSRRIASALCLPKDLKSLQAIDSTGGLYEKPQLLTFDKMLISKY